MNRVFSKFRIFAKCKKGMAATEFALLLPIMITLFFGMLEVSDIATANRRVAIANNTMADLAAQSIQLTYDDVNSLIDGAMAILEPDNPAAITVNVLSIILDPDDGPVIHWSRDEAGGQPFAPGDQYTFLDDEDVLSSQASLIVIEITYPYSPPFTSYFVSAPVIFNKTSIRWPRIAPGGRVQLCDNNEDNCTT